MKKIKYLYSAFLLYVFSGLCGQTNMIISPVSALAAAQNLVGPNSGITILNATLIGDQNQIGTFSNSVSNFQVSNGIVVSNGNAIFASTSNTGNDGDQSISSTGANGIINPDLAVLAGSNITQYGTVILDIEFKSEGKVLNLNYVYASEEYNFYAGNSYADPLGIFIAGTNIGGHVPINKIGTDNINVNTVNGCTNSTYYINNCRTNNNQQCTGSCGAVSIDVHEIPYNGFTKKMTATYTLPVCDPTGTYHLFITICNANDHNRDSGVFLEAGSMKSEVSIGNLVANPSPVCDGSSFNIALQNPPSSPLTYNWSTGQSGVNLSSINTNASLGVTSYNVNIVNTGCTVTRSINVIVHSNNNVPPYTNGVNNSGSNVIYVSAGQNNCVSIPSFDSPNENVIISSPNYPAGSSFIGIDPPSQQIGNFCWLPTQGQIGSHNFDIVTTDNNACMPLSNPQPYIVKVACASCDLDIYYQNRHPASNPLPAFTKAARKIVAGDNVIANQPPGTVETGAATVEFKSAQIIANLPGFIAGPGYWAHIEPNTCINDCEDCCDHWTGFTMEPLPTVVLADGDGVDERFTVNDYAHPRCAYGAKSYTLSIYERSNLLVTLTSSPTNACCPFQSALPGSAGYSSINWDPPNIDQDYAYILELSGCGHYQSYLGNFQVRGTGSGHRMAATDSIPAAPVKNTDSLNFYNQTVTPSDRELAEGPFARGSHESLKLYPNPAADKTTCLFQTGNAEDASPVELNIENILGVLVKTLQIKANQAQEIDLKALPAGTYFVKGSYHFTTFNTAFIIAR